VQVKDIIEQEVNQPGDVWRELKNQVGHVSKAVGISIKIGYEHH
tara:strand:- start:183 stop:314 length:132 start_codon:yes stop_codon:yes gene_type:complete